MIRSATVAVLAGVAAATLACGQKGPPLPPLHLVPAAPADATVMRVGDEARLRFVVPSTNLNGPGAIDIEQVEIFAATVAPGATPPPNRELLTAKYRVGVVAVEPPPVEGESAPANAPPDPRPSAGETTTFTEKLTPETLKPAFTTMAPKVPPAAAAGATPPPAVEEPPPPSYASRIYAVRGVSKSGRPGQAAARLALPLVDPPSPPTSLSAAPTETAVVLTWKSGVAATVPATFNVYKVGGSDPINKDPIASETYERAGIQFGTEECFAVRAVEKVGTVTTESELSEPACLTPKDTYAPKAPQHLSAVAAPGVISLSWDANTEADLAGYLVLRGEAPGDTLQPLTASPITATNFEDKTATPNVRYAYAIVAVDKAAPPNRSAQSARVEETAR